LNLTDSYMSLPARYIDNTGLLSLPSSLALCTLHPAPSSQYLVLSLLFNGPSCFRLLSFDLSHCPPPTHHQPTIPDVVVSQGSTVILEIIHSLVSGIDSSKVRSRY
jgi:hypothetical protein